MTNHVQPSSDDASKPQPPDGTFVYAPLDHDKASIRLIRVLATRTHEGYIQCEIRHASIYDSYICLSYVWGKPGDEHYIMVNDRIMRVRCNLYGFLEAAARKDRLRAQWLWIDALCIDQTNVGERNHQVRQMGLIFSSAKEVMSWLGDNAEIAAYFQWIGRKHREKNATLSAEDCPHFGTVERKGRSQFRYSEYWTRAWITQEVALAKRVVLCSGDAEWNFASLPQHEHYPATITTLLPSASGQLHGRSILFLIRQFEFKRCQLRRDVVYSLLAVSGDGSDVQVDYNTPLITVESDVLRSCKQSFCFCTVHIVCSILEDDPYMPYTAVDCQQYDMASPMWSVPASVKCKAPHLIVEDALLEEASASSARSTPTLAKYETELAGHSDIYRYLGTATTPLVYLRLPFIRGTISSNRDHGPDTLSFAQQLPEKDYISVSIAPSQICKSMKGPDFVIMFSKRRIIPTSVCHCSPLVRLNDCILIISEDTCTVFFTLNDIRTIALGYGSRTSEAIYPCNRINFHGTESAATLDMPVLTLCSGTLPESEYRITYHGLVAPSCPCPVNDYSRSQNAGISASLLGASAPFPRISSCPCPVNDDSQHQGDLWSRNRKVRQSAWCLGASGPRLP